MKRNIIFIDDEEDLCELYEDLFSTTTNIVKSFVDTDGALDYIKSNSVNICFLDYRMPKINGAELRKLIPSNIPCILLTGELMTNPEQGFIDVLNKPINENEFEDILRKHAPLSK